MNNANYWIDKLKLIKHPEGGYFREAYRSQENITRNALPNRYKGDRSFATSIYFLLDGDDFSSFHRIQSDETWHFYLGSTIELFALDEKGKLVRHLLGQNPEANENIQVTIPKSYWFGARLVNKTSFALLGCTVAPGFHFDDFELADRKKLTKLYPNNKSIIRELTIH